MKGNKRRRHLDDIGEDGIIDLFRRFGGGPAGTVAFGIGDDAALLRPPSGGRLLVTTDLLTEGIHFDLPGTPPEALGYKLAAANASDIGAMGGTPFGALLSLALPTGTEATFVRAFARGLRKGSRAFGFHLVGGDTTTSRGGIFAGLVLLGTPAGRRPLLRSGAGPGDRLFVTGHLGASALGLAALQAGRGESLRTVVGRHLRPSPPHLFGAALGREGLATAAIDISDGLVTDLRRLCNESNAGAEIEPTKIPIRPATRKAAAILGRDPVEAALYGGEEYELLFTVRGSREDRLRRLAKEMKVRISAIGTITRGRRLTALSEDGSKQVLKPGGWRHFQSP